MPSPLPDASQPLPPVLVGPLLRRLEPTRLVLWLVGSRALSLTLRLQNRADMRLDAGQCTIIPVGAQAFVHLIDVALDTALPCDTLIEYDLLIDDAATGIAEWAPHLLYGEARSPNLVVRSKIDQLLHGSCRKPHFPAADGLLCVDRLLAAEHEAKDRPALLMMSGDQVYADDVAGPTLRAIHALIERLGLFEEHLEGAVVSDSAKLYEHAASYYHRADLLPALQGNETLRERFFGGARKPIFTSSSADNHLVTFAEVMAMYFLVWSPTPWTLIAPKPPKLIPERRMAVGRFLPLRGKIPVVRNIVVIENHQTRDVRKGPSHAGQPGLEVVDTRLLQRITLAVLKAHHRQRADCLYVVPGLGQQSGCVRHAAEEDRRADFDRGRPVSG